MKRFLFSLSLFLLPVPALALDFGSMMDISPLVPIVLDSLILVASSTYEFFVGSGRGILYFLIWGWVAIWIAMYAIKMWFPTNILSFFGFSGGGEIWGDKFDGMSAAQNILKPIVRASIATVLLLGTSPIILTEWLVDPFLQIGSLYSEFIVQDVANLATNINTCPEGILSAGWLSSAGCEFLLRPISVISSVNGGVVNTGFDLLLRGLAGMITPGADGFLNFITGLILMWTFISMNFSMALIIIQGIFNFGAALILYPFNILVYVIKNKEDWFNPIPVFKGVIDALRNLMIVMIVCGVILVINIAVVNALFGLNGEINGFGEHSIVWLSAILTFYILFEILKTTREVIDGFAKKEKLTELHDNMSKDVKSVWGRATSAIKTGGKNIGKFIKGDS